MFPANTPLEALSLTVQLPAAGARVEEWNHGKTPTLVWAILLLPLAGRRRWGKRTAHHWLRLGLLLLGVVGAIGQSGCGSSGFFAPGQASYTITVTATSGTLSHSTTLTLKVKQ
jgi:hypothetical protein